MKIGVIADDFTGASDIGLTLAEGGMRVSQFVGIPKGHADQDLDAAVVALKSRTAPVDEAVRDSLAACDWLLSQGAQQIVFKVCSTFDSTAKGNIGPVLDALTERLNAPTTIVCPAFPENGRSVYQGHLFVQDKLLNESGMQNHPLTPMTDPDLRRLLAAQSARPVHHVAALLVMQGAAAIQSALPAKGHTIVDAIRDADLLEIGKAARDTLLLCGGSGIALGLPENFGFKPRHPQWDGVSGPGIVLSGSCSRATREQVARYRDIAPHREVTARDAVSGSISVEELVNWALEQKQPPLIYSSADPQVVRQAQGSFGKEKASAAIENLFSDLSRSLRTAGFRRMVIAGGETSGAVVQGLRAQQLQIGPRLAAGVPMVLLAGTPSVALALKSGNFGGPDFFADALNRMEQQQ
ncbi:3-oxo-tetronate kinase [Ruegeria arenilitoris]|uniref:3-oxo-tetronate kinase n=1 Tax=Ruegeria arenilitoris TaxID=1173585 RepID=UPI0014808437|nr:3-oxo-tetronate kinase [Ruegeria arenilitoris]